MIFGVQTPKTQATKAKPDKWDYIKIRSFSIAEEMINRVKSQPTQWKKIFARPLSDKWLIFRIQWASLPLGTVKLCTRCRLARARVRAWRRRWWACRPGHRAQSRPPVCTGSSPSSQTETSLVPVQCQSVIFGPHSVFYGKVVLLDILNDGVEDLQDKYVTLIYTSYNAGQAI